ncbi:MAG: hypothetical protein BWY32_01865 [bacterium ADurb.Bin243]|nr:MAG: hypothetical protein BWY32_01865 [bacterium ADurb.Bin243]
MESKVQTSIVLLRVSVGFLGESHQNAWWASSFFSSASGAYISPVFGKTPFLARYHGTLEAASKIHDEHIGVGKGVFHLFRLPEMLERECHLLLSDPETVEAAMKTISNKETSMAYLENVSKKTDHNGVGPVLVGQASDVKKTSGWKTIAHYYLKAFSEGSKVFPYFSGTK